MSTRDALKKMMFQTIIKLKTLNFTEDEATNMVIGIVDFNKEYINDLSHMKMVLDGLISINK